MSDAKACSKCGGSVQGAARFCDRAGNLYCATCAKGSGAATAKPEQPPASTAQPAAAGPEAADGYALADEPAPATGVASGKRRSDLIPCPGCGGTLLRSAVLCTKCGFNLVAGVSAEAEAPGGLPKSAPKRRKTVRDDVMREHRAAYIKAMVITGICLPVAMGFLAAIMGDPASVVFGLCVFVVMFAVTCVVYFACAAIWIGFDSPLGLDLLRLLAVCSITEIFRSMTSALPPNMRVQGVAYLLVGCVFVGALMTLMEMEKEDAIIFAVITAGVRLALGMILLHYAIENGWLETA